MDLRKLSRVCDSSKSQRRVKDEFDWEKEMFIMDKYSDLLEPAIKKIAPSAETQTDENFYFMVNDTDWEFGDDEHPNITFTDEQVSKIKSLFKKNGFEFDEVSEGTMYFYLKKDLQKKFKGEELTVKDIPSLVKISDSKSTRRVQDKVDRGDDFDSEDAYFVTEAYVEQLKPLISKISKKFFTDFVEEEAVELTFQVSYLGGTSCPEKFQKKLFDLMEKNHFDLIENDDPYFVFKMNKDFADNFYYEGWRAEDVKVVGGRSKTKDSEELEDFCSKLSDSDLNNLHSAIRKERISRSSK